ncbi:lysophospholipid acyltransferase family protein [Petrotoga sp. 8T1HF07.NaAc.6.1]|jgi:1-acyl-sn-glycerol-3-phosphate acyltransferase|uniref:lysophospholipid acyltransferase family protein n=1 Tax=Petrotoga sp. 8T1HF07.NaAc.6.1 TaxID=1351838 RepID=UPI00192AD72F|nr:lysophospholipid acyltransferase family protein [Petrotoga sp. 8T1HF07.NaAc.6.1]
MKKVLETIKAIFFTIWLIIGFLGVVIVYGSYVLIKANILEKRKGHKVSQEYIRKVVSWFGKVTFKFLNSKISVHGEENIPQQGPYVVVANHQSLFDIPLILGYIYPTAFIAKKELSMIPILGNFIKRLGSIFIDRNNSKSGAIALKKFAKISQSGEIITIFPEGTRSLDGQVGEFKKGALLIPFRYNIKILPVTIDGTIKMSKKGSVFIKPSNVNLFIHEPVEPKLFASEGELRECLKSIISEKVTSEPQLALKETRA